MAAKKKSAPAKSKSKAKPAAKQPAKAAKKAKPAAKVTLPKAKAAKKAKPAAKVTLPKAKAAKTVKPVKAAKPTKAAKSTKAAKPTKADEPSLMTRIKGAASKVMQAAAAAASKVLDSDSDAGRPAPAFDLTDEKGEHVSSSSLAGKPYLLYFYPKDDTPGCTKEACDIRDNFGRFGQQGLRVLGVSPDSQQSHAKFGKKYGLPFTLLSDPDKTLANAYGVWGLKNNYGKEYMGIIRSTFLVGPDGQIKKSYRGVKVPGHVDAILEDAKTLLS
jgi:thioredoxin-dependent peroxiredoxin